MWLCGCVVVGFCICYSVVVGYLAVVVVYLLCSFLIVGSCWFVEARSRNCT